MPFSWINLPDIANRDISRPGLIKPGSRKHRSNIDIHTLLAVVTFLFISTLVFTLRHRLNLRLADPKVYDFPFSIQSTILYALLKLISFRPAMLVRSFTVSKLVNKMTCQFVINHFCTRYTLFMCSFEHGHLLELHVYVNCAALYRTFIPQSFLRGNNSNGPVAGRVWRMVVGQGQHKQKTRNTVV